MTGLLRMAFAALGDDGDGLERVAGALRASGDAETLTLFDSDEHGFDRGYFTVLEIAQSVPESNGFVALDLFTEVCSPGRCVGRWSAGGCLMRSASSWPWSTGEVRRDRRALRDSRGRP